MLVIDKEVLDRFRRLDRCEYCGKRGRGYLHPHHLFCRGAGGGSRIDLRRSLMGLCHICHRLFHDGHIPRRDLMEVVAAREGMTVDALQEYIWRVLRAPKDSLICPKCQEPYQVTCAACGGVG